MNWVLIGFLLVYAWVIFRCRQAWVGEPDNYIPAGDVPQTPVSVIVAVRDEALNIMALLTDLERQIYPAALLEVMVVDDHSTDGTRELVQAFAAGAGFPVHYLALPGGSAGKKAAVRAGISQARGELLAFTDGDCRVQPDWLRHLEYQYRTGRAAFISGPVTFKPVKTFFDKLQALEFASLVGVGGASILAGKPNMCNGANMAYPRQVFTEVGGFAGNEHLASGDDEFLLHKIFRLYPDRVFFLKAPGAIVFTQTQPTMLAFIRQRVRWASKWPAYEHAAPKLLALLVFGVNLGLLLSLVGWLAGYQPAEYFWSALGLKLGADMCFLWPVLGFLGQRKHWPYLLFLQFFYVPYVVVTALAGLGPGYQWKNRRVRKTVPVPGAL